LKVVCPARAADWICNLLMFAGHAQLA